MNIRRIQLKNGKQLTINPQVNGTTRIEIQTGLSKTVVAILTLQELLNLSTQMNHAYYEMLGPVTK